MSGTEYAAIIRATHAMLENKTGYGRMGAHSMRVCPVCRVHVCMTHHECPER